MRHTRPTFLLFVTFLISIPVAAQQPPQRDPQAMAVLAQMTAATRWQSGNVPIDAVATGTFMRFNGDTQDTASFSIKQRGSTQHRMEAQRSGATTTTIVNGLAAAILPSQGAMQRLPAQTALSMQSAALPFFSDLVKTADSDVEILYLGNTTVDGVPCVGVGIARHSKGNDALTVTRNRAAPLKIWVSQTSFLPVRIDFVRLAVDNQFVVMHFSHSFSDYRVVNGIAVAFQQEERFEGQLMYRFQFTTVQFNAGLTDADFDLSKR